MGNNFVESGDKCWTTLEMALLNLNCGDIIFNRQFEISRGRYVNSDEYLVGISNPLMRCFSKGGMTNEQSKKLYSQILQDVHPGCMKILFKYPNSFEVISDDS